MRRFRALVFILLTASALLRCSGDNIGPGPSGPYLVNVLGAGPGSGSVVSQPSGLDCTLTGGSETGQCSQAFPAQTNIALTATGSDGFAFTGWTGACAGIDPTCEITLSAPVTVTASFSAGPYTLSVAGQGSGTISSSPDGIDCVITAGVPAQAGCSASYPAGTAVTLSASPANGGTFSGWSGPCSGTGTCQVTMNGPAAISANFGQPGNGNEATVGKWDPPFSTPIVAVHLHMLATGKVMFFGLTPRTSSSFVAVPDGRGESEIWDPQRPDAGFTHSDLDAEIFCSGHTILPDGRVLVVGGHLSDGHGTKDANLFDPRTETWTRLPDLKYGRWYPTATVLTNGETLVTSGADENHIFIKNVEIWNGSSFREVTVPNGWGYYPRIFTAPNGKQFVAGEYNPSRWFDPVTGKFTDVAHRLEANRSYGGAVMYAPGKVLYAGGAQQDAAPPTNTAEVIDLNVGSPAWRATGSMAFARHQVNTVLLPDGKVLAIGGTAGIGKTNEAAAVRSAEMWDPATGQWTTLASQATPRIYHSTAVLLPDARVLSAGGGEAPGMTQQRNAEIYWPPYLFNQDGSLATRPVITTAPAEIRYGQSFSVQAQEASTVSRGNLIRLGSATHSFDMSQHIYPLTFTSAGTTFTATAPPNSGMAPPGPYMLFLLNDKGVPSVAKIVMLKQ